MSLDWYGDILEFADKFGHYIEAHPCIPPEKVKVLRKNLIKEETEELLKAIEEDDLEGIADGAADSIVVILGTLIAYGIVFQSVWDEVHRTNMAKVGGATREDGKSLKPEGWQPPDIKSILVRQGGEIA